MPVEPTVLWALGIIIVALVAFLGFIGRLWATGRVVARQAVMDAQTVLEDRLADRDHQIVAVRAERDEWKAAYHAEAQTNSTLARQLDVSLEATRTFDRFLRSFPAALPPGGGHHEPGT